METLSVRPKQIYRRGSNARIGPRRVASEEGGGGGGSSRPWCRRSRAWAYAGGWRSPRSPSSGRRSSCPAGRSRSWRPAARTRRGCGCCGSAGTRPTRLRCERRAASARDGSWGGGGGSGSPGEPAFRLVLTGLAASRCSTIGGYAAPSISGQPRRTAGPAETPVPAGCMSQRGVPIVADISRV